MHILNEFASINFSCPLLREITGRLNQPSQTPPRALGSRLDLCCWAAALDIFLHQGGNSQILQANVIVGDQGYNYVFEKICWKICVEPDRASLLTEPRVYWLWFWEEEASVFPASGSVPGIKMEICRTPLRARIEQIPLCCCVPLGWE